MRFYGAMVLGVISFGIVGLGLAYAQDFGAMDQADMQAAQKGVDPKRQMGESERNLAALAAIYQYRMNKGDPDGAARAAFSMLQHHRLAAQRYAAIAAAALEKGDVSGATKAIMKSYANIPDGKDLKLAVGKGGQVQYTYTDEKTGKVMSSGLATPPQMAAAAMGVGKEDFYKFLLAAAEPEITRRSIEQNTARRGSVSNTPKRALRMPTDPPLDTPTMGPRGPINCITIDMGDGDSSTNCH